VYAGSLTTKTEEKLANAVPGAVKGAMHEKMARPVGEKWSHRNNRRRTWQMH
jgi:hypothetical protein